MKLISSSRRGRRKKKEKINSSAHSLSWYTYCKAYLLAARPVKVMNGEGAYVRRAQERADTGVNRLYVFGTYDERDFAKQVIGAIQQNVPEYQLAEHFMISKDYRGNASGGIGALFIRKP